MFVDLMPDVALVCAEGADRQGNLYTGPNTEDTPAIVEAAAFHAGVVVVQVNEIVDELPRVDIPASWVDVVVAADRPFEVEPLFTRDPRLISDVQILIAMLVIRGIYERHGVTTLNHGIGFDTAAIELLLPTYGEKLGLRGKICRNWVLNPHPTLIPAIESGWVESVVCFGSEVGMADYTRARPDVFFTGHDGSLRSNWQLPQRSSPVNMRWTCSSGLRFRWTPKAIPRRSPRGGWPASVVPPTWAAMCVAAASLEPSMVVDMVTHTVTPPARGAASSWCKWSRPSPGRRGQQSIVEELDAIAVGKKAGMPIVPVMIYGDDVYPCRDRGRHRLISSRRTAWRNARRPSRR